MLDRSGSMAQTGQWGTAGPTKWQNAVDALNAFVGDSGSAGLQVVLQYFAIDDVDYGVPFLLPGPAWTTGSPHDVPAVAMALLPDNGASFSGSLQTTLPNGAGTPIEAALRGVTKYCAVFQTQNPEWQCVSVLISDGQPSHCSLDVNVLAGIAGTARANDGVTTFAVAMDGADFNIMNAIATQGQGDCDGNAAGYQACNVTASQTAFLDALRRIRETISVQTRTEMRTELQPQPLECEWGIPPPPDGED